MAVKAAVMRRPHLFLFLADGQTEAEVLGQLVLGVEAISEVDAPHATVGVNLQSVCAWTFNIRGP